MHPSTESKNRGINSNSDKCVKTGNKKKRINDVESKCKNRAKTLEEDDIASLLAREGQPRKKKLKKKKRSTDSNEPPLVTMLLKTGNGSFHTDVSIDEATICPHF